MRWRTVLQTAWWSPMGYMPIALNRHNGRITQALLPKGGKYWAYWAFDIGFVDGTERALVLQLTRDEARRVLDSDPLVEGFLEPVRATLRDTRAFIAARHPTAGEYARGFIVPREGDEAEFLAVLDEAAQLPENIETMTAHTESRAAMSEVERIVRPRARRAEELVFV